MFSFFGLANGSVSDTHNGLNQVTQTGATNVTHDARGNTTAIGSASYGYSSENLMTSGPNGTTLAYDPLGRLYEVSAGGTTRRFVYDGFLMVGEYDGTGAIARRYVHGPGVDEPLVWYEIGDSTERRFRGLAPRLFGVIRKRSGKLEKRTKPSAAQNVSMKPSSPGSAAFGHSINPGGSLRRPLFLSAVESGPPQRNSAHASSPAKP